MYLRSVFTAVGLAAWLSLVSCSNVKTIEVRGEVLSAIDRDPVLFVPIVQRGDPPADAPFFVIARCDLPGATSVSTVLKTASVGRQISWQADTRIKEREIEIVYGTDAKSQREHFRVSCSDHPFELKEGRVFLCDLTPGAAEPVRQLDAAVPPETIVPFREAILSEASPERDRAYEECAQAILNELITRNESVKRFVWRQKESVEKR